MATTTQTTPQYTLERLYVSPLTKKRGFDERNLEIIMVPMETKRQMTGIKLLDAVVDCLIAGTDPRSVAYHYGVTLQKLSALVFTMTGLTLVSLRKQWRMRMARELLCYTELPLKDVMQRCGYSSMPTFSNFVRQTTGQTPLDIRRDARQRGLIGKYAL